MRIVDSGVITENVKTLVEKVLKTVDRGVIKKLEKCCSSETEELSKWALDTIIRNDKISLSTDSYPCQDTGVAVVFIKLGNNVHIDGKTLTEAVNDGVRSGYAEARKSVLDPLSRINTGDNTPAIIYTDIVKGENIEISFLAKGAGSENMSRTYMLTPSKGRQGIINSATDCVRAAGSNPCPPIILGVGIGGTLDKAALLSKEALLEDINAQTENEDIRNLEKDILSEVNALGIGAQGFGGKNTCLAVKVKTFPTHIGMLPVAVTVQCHSARHGKIII